MLLHSKIEGNGSPLLILHGYLGMSDNWKTLSTQYAQNGFEVHSLDLRNHGRSFHSDEFNYKVMVDDILHYCDHHNLDKINVIGHSMGGKLAMFLAVLHPEKVEKLIIADISTRAYRPHHQDILQALNAVDFSLQKERKEVEEVMAHYVPDFGTRQFLMKNVYRKSPDELAFRINLKTLTEKYDDIGIAVPENTTFEKPTLFLKGENSGYIKERDEQDIIRHFPQAEIKIISKSGHWLHAENPKEFLELSLSYLVS
ncbi:MAG: alpha/beta fold hydrolase [Flavobacteriaceae bacterium]